MARRKGPSLDRQQVIEAAIAVIEAEGPDALGVSRVARALGIQPPSIYNHVGKGDALPRRVMIEGNRRLLATLKEAVRGVVDPHDQVLTLALATRQWALDNAALYTVMARVEPDNDHPEFRPILLDTLDLFARPLAQLGVASGDTVHAIRGLRAAMHGFLLLETTGQFQLDDDPAASFRWLVEAILRGLQTPP